CELSGRCQSLPIRHQAADTVARFLALPRQECRPAPALIPHDCSSLAHPCLALCRTLVWVAPVSPALLLRDGFARERIRPRSRRDSPPGPTLLRKNHVQL